MNKFLLRSHPLCPSGNKKILIYLHITQTYIEPRILLHSEKCGIPFTLQQWNELMECENDILSFMQQKIHKLAYTFESAENILKVKSRLNQNRMLMFENTNKESGKITSVIIAQPSVNNLFGYQQLFYHHLHKLERNAAEIGSFVRKYKQLKEEKSTSHSDFDYTSNGLDFGELFYELRSFGIDE